MAINNDLSVSYEYNSTDKRRDKIKIGFSYDVMVEAGVNVENEVKKWQNQVGKIHPIYTGRKRLGPKNMRLVSASVSDVRLDKDGYKRSASIALSFEENKKAAPKKEKKKKNQNLRNARRTKKKKKSKK